jgi:hypothetical protein
VPRKIGKSSPVFHSIEQKGDSSRGKFIRQATSSRVCTRFPIVFRFSVAMKLRVAMRLDERMYFPEVSHRKHVARVVENAQLHVGQRARKVITDPACRKR